MDVNHSSKSKGQGHESTSKVYVTLSEDTTTLEAQQLMQRDSVFYFWMFLNFTFSVCEKFDQAIAGFLVSIQSDKNFGRQWFKEKAANPFLLQKYANRGVARSNFKRAVSKVAKRVGFPRRSVPWPNYFPNAFGCN